MTPFTPKQISILITLVSTIFLSHQVNATSIDPSLWEQLVDQSDFVGVVECTVAGGIVAKYKVIDSWMGPEKGATISIRIPPDPSGSQFPIALCGQRYLVMASEYETPTQMASLLWRIRAPLMWRIIPAEYSLPLFQGMLANPATATRYFNSHCKNLPEFKEKVIQWLQLKPNEKRNIFATTII